MIIRYILFALIQPFLFIIRSGKFLNWVNPNKGKAINVNVLINKSEKDGTQLCSVKNLGFQLCTYKIKGRKYFRLSFAKRIKKFVIILQLGMNQSNYKYTFLKIKKWQRG